MWVVKLGGSLADDDSLPHWLKILCSKKEGRLVLVPGGGGFAKQVRESQLRWGFADRTAHHMAILAMHQMGLMLSDLASAMVPCKGLGGVIQAMGGDNVPVWLPDLAELDREGVPANWEVTSDSLAAWLAGKLEAQHLVLVKSAILPSQEPVILQRTGIVDAAFLSWLPPGLQFHCYHRDQFDLFAQSLNG